MSQSLLSSAFYLLAFIVTLGVLITVHEFGHFWVARRLGVKVLRFSIGFGAPIWLRRSRVDGTEFAVTAIPLGGYVRMLDEREGPVAAAELPRAFNRQPVGSRIAIVAAGPLFNLLFAVLAYTLLFMTGVSGIRPLLDAPPPDSVAARAGFEAGDLITAVAGQPTPTLQAVSMALLEQGLEHERIPVQVQDETGQLRLRILDLHKQKSVTGDGDVLGQLGLAPWPVPAIVGQVLEGKPGQRAGLLPGDHIVAIDGQPIKDWQQLVNYVETRPGQTLTLAIERQGQPKTLQVTTEAVESGNKGKVGKIGISGQVPEEMVSQMRVVVRYGPFRALAEGIAKTWDTSWFTLRMLGRMLIGKASLSNISGPITIAKFAGQAASVGLAAFLSFLALVSISLGVLNLLPVPILDGGHLLYYLIELIKGSPLSDVAQELGQRVGMVLLVMLMGLALFNDLSRLLG
ncbi:MAG TPA: RIP metalloprotease RseP [Candidatus Competibacteraceae bacterium]|nr:RIP metalloprotease RseP [Candidatus Competibacteraceae bacterium]